MTAVGFTMYVMLVQIVLMNVAVAVLLEVHLLGHPYRKASINCTIHLCLHARTCTQDLSSRSFSDFGILVLPSLRVFLAPWKNMKKRIA